MSAFIRIAADGTLFIILLVAAPLLLVALKKAWWENLPVLVMAALTSLLIGKLLSLIYQPAVMRPFLEQGVQPGAAYINNPGFPSDHALLATVVVVAVYAVTRHTKVTLILATLTVVMCIARVMALVHTPLDVIGGILAGLTGAVWYVRLTK